MSFSIDPPDNDRIRTLRYNSESINVPVGELSFEKGQWMFHHYATASGLTDAGKAEVKLLITETLVLAKITKRLTS